MTANDLVTQECLKATKDRYLEPYREMKTAALALAQRVIELETQLAKQKAEAI